MDFEEWWSNCGSGMTPHPNEDREEHARRVAEAAWIARQRTSKDKGITFEQLQGQEEAEC